MKTLRDVLPREAINSGEFIDDKFHKYLDYEVIEEIKDFTRTPEYEGQFPFKHKNIHVWWILEDNIAVAWNENPSRGWSFHVAKMKKEKSGSPPRYLGTYTPIAILTITFYPIYWMTFQWELLVLYILSWSVLALSMYTAGCARCIDFICKNNAVPDELRDAYLLSQNK